MPLKGALFRAIHPLWRALPIEARRRIFFELHAVGLRRDPAEGLPRPLYVTGLYRVPTGLGEAVRQQSRGLSLAGIDHVPVDLSGTMLGEASLPPWPGTGALLDGPGTILLHAHAPIMSYALARLGRERIRQKKLIGFWHWELPLLPPLWSASERLLHEIWVPSQFVAQAVARSIALPVRVLPYPLDAPDPPAPSSETGFTRRRRFEVVTMFNMMSGFARKNPLGAIAAFKQAFGDSDAVRLRIKAQHCERYAEGHRAILSAIGAAKNIELITQPMTRDEIWAFIAGSDAVLSLHRAEGLGLLVAEGMAMARAVIATDYSSTAEFLKSDCGIPVPFQLVPARDPQGLYPGPKGSDAELLRSGQVWAEPDIAFAADALQRLSADAALRQALGLRARAAFEAHFGQAVFARRALDLLGRATE